MTVFARVTITVEIDVDATWNDTVNAAQFHKQAVDNAHQILRRGLIINGTKITGGHRPHPATIIGEPKVVAILADVGNGK